jgi:hypothetical protein
MGAKKKGPEIVRALVCGGGMVPRTKRLLKYAIEALRVVANPCELDRKACGTAFGCGQADGFFALIGDRKGCSSSSAFRGQFNSETGTEPASVATANNTPIYTLSGGKAVYHAANGTHIHRIKCGD